MIRADLLEQNGMRIVGTTAAGASRTPRHHLFPVKLFGSEDKTKKWFQNIGIEIDRITIGLTEGVHSAVHSREWDDLLRERLIRLTSEMETYGARDVWNVMYRQMREFNIRNVTFLPYKS
jgi:hypothetical protein